MLVSAQTFNRSATGPQHRNMRSSIQHRVSRRRGPLADGIVYRGTSLIRNCHPLRTTVGP
jgi:hypothetical protein